MFDDKSFYTTSFSSSFLFGLIETIKTVVAKLKSTITTTFNIKSDL